MKKKPPTLRVENQRLHSPQKTKPQKPKPPLVSAGVDPSPVSRHKRVSYGPGTAPCEEPVDMPRLFIRGFGGSIKIDLQGVGIGCSDGVFAHGVGDDSLRAINVLPGDIALIEPVIRSFRVGNLVLLDLDGRPTLRRLSKKGRIWRLGPLDGHSSETFALIDHPLQGVVIGFLRLLQEFRPVQYRGTDADFAPHLEISSLPDKKVVARIKSEGQSECLIKTAKKPAVHYGSSRLNKSQILLSEVDQKKRYKVKPERIHAHWRIKPSK